jgi:hypothetical protein
MSDGNPLTINSYLKTPKKTKTIGGITYDVQDKKTGARPFSEMNSATQPEPIKISFTTGADYQRQVAGTRFDKEKGTLEDAASFSKKSLAGLAGVGYNALLLVSVKGRAAQLTAKGLGIGLGTTSLMLGDDYSFGKAAGISGLAFLLKGTNNGYDWFNNVTNSVRTRIGTSNIGSRVANGIIGGWQTFGQQVYKNGYHAIPTINPLGLIPGGSHYGLSILPAQWFEAGVTKAASKSTFGFFLGKKPYQPYYTGQSAVDQLYLENSTFNNSPLSLSSDIMLSNPTYIKPSSLIDNRVTLRSTLPTGTVMDSMDPNPNKLMLKPPPKEKTQTETEKLIGFMNEFDAAAPKNKWVRKYQEIMHPEKYASYNKAMESLVKENLSVLPGRSKVEQWFYDVIFGDIEKSIKRLSSGVENSNKLFNGIDQNADVVEKLARFKVELEAAGGKFIIESNGSYHIQPPTEEQDKIYTNKLRTRWRMPKNEAEKDARDKEDAANNTKVQQNIPAIREMMKNQNKYDEDLALRKFIKTKYGVDTFNQRLGSNLENIQKLTKRSKAQVIDAFYTANPKYQTEDYKLEKKLLTFKSVWERKQHVGWYNNYYGLNRKGKSAFQYDPKSGLRRVVVGAPGSGYTGSKN